MAISDYPLPKNAKARRDPTRPMDQRQSSDMSILGAPAPLPHISARWVPGTMPALSQSGPWSHFMLKGRKGLSMIPRIGNAKQVLEDAISGQNPRTMNSTSAATC
jgi:hypothetical protein